MPQRVLPKRNQHNQIISRQMGPRPPLDHSPKMRCNSPDHTPTELQRPLIPLAHGRRQTGRLAEGDHAVLTNKVRFGALEVGFGERAVSLAPGEESDRADEVVLVFQLVTPDSGEVVCADQVKVRFKESISSHLPNTTTSA